MGVPIYPSDFAPEPVSAYAPVTGDLFFNLPLAALAILLLAGLAIGAFAYWLGQGRREPGDNVEAVWKAVSRAIQAAVSAPRDQVVAKGRALSDTLEHELGPILAFAGPVVGPCGRLKAAIKGEDETGHGGKGHEAETPASPIERMVIHARKVTINTGETVDHGDDDGHGDHDHDHGHGGHGGHGHDDHGHGHGKPLTADEQIAAVRQAVHALADHWSDRRARIGELRAIRRRLIAPHGASSVPPLSKG